MKYILFLSLSLALTSCGVIRWYYIPDNPIEESLEDKIEEYTGLDLDLSPTTQEQN